MYACNYNRQKFANLAKCDEKLTIPIPAPLSAKAIKRPLPVPPPVPPTPPPLKPNDLIEEDDKIDADDERVVLDRKQKKRRTRSLERLRDQSNDIELSDSDEDIAIAQKIPTIKSTDELDASATSPSISEALNAISNTTADEPAICADSPGLAIDASTFSDKSQLSYDEILKIEESFDEDGANGFMNKSIVVDIHAEPTIELRIHESDSDPAIQESSRSVPGIFNASKLTKEQIKTDFEQERCFSEDDAIDPDDDDDKEKPERLVQSDSEVLSKTPLELVVECDINENVIVSETKSRETIDLDHNHNDIVKPAEIFTDQQSEIKTKPTDSEPNAKIKLVQNRESPSIVPQNEPPQHRESISSRSSCCESDGNEPVYATVDTTLNTVSFSSLKRNNFLEFENEQKKKIKQRNLNQKKEWNHILKKLNKSNRQGGK